MPLAPSPDDVKVRVSHATGAFAFVPFTDLPKRYAGKTVAIVVYETDPDEDLGDLPPWDERIEREQVAAPDQLF